jgi:uncharacterized protein
VGIPTAIPGWTAAESPFHAGELAVQDRIGVREQLDLRVRRAGIRDYMPEQHRRFFGELPFIVVACADAADAQPSVSLLVAPPGFVTAPDAHTLHIAAPLLPGSSIAGRLHVGTFIGALGIQFATRRRNRVNGVVTASEDDALTVAVTQSFGNCAKYIQRREGLSIAATSIAAPAAVCGSTRLAPADRHLIESADTLFIGTANLDPGAGLARGVDVSHRGGRPGFVRVDDDHTLTMPEFVGNSYFNTLGNLVENSKAALLFVDFASGDLLHVECNGEIVWDGAEMRAFEGAQRLVRFRVRHAHRAIGMLTIDGAVPQYAPELGRTGTWKKNAPG